MKTGGDDKHSDYSGVAIEKPQDTRCVAFPQLSIRFNIINSGPRQLVIKLTRTQLSTFELIWPIRFTDRLCLLDAPP